MTSHDKNRAEKTFESFGSPQLSTSRVPFRDVSNGEVPLKHAASSFELSTFEPTPPVRRSDCRRVRSAGRVRRDEISTHQSPLRHYRSVGSFCVSPASSGKKGKKKASTPGRRLTVDDEPAIKDESCVVSTPNGVGDLCMTSPHMSVAATKQSAERRGRVGGRPISHRIVASASRTASGIAPAMPKEFTPNRAIIVESEHQRSDDSPVEALSTDSLRRAFGPSSFAIAAPLSTTPRCLHSPDPKNYLAHPTEDHGDGDIAPDSPRFASPNLFRRNRAKINVAENGIASTSPLRDHRQRHHRRQHGKTTSSGVPTSPSVECNRTDNETGSVVENESGRVVGKENDDNAGRNGDDDPFASPMSKKGRKLVFPKSDDGASAKGRRGRESKEEELMNKVVSRPGQLDFLVLTSKSAEKASRSSSSRSLSAPNSAPAPHRNGRKGHSSSSSSSSGSDMGDEGQHSSHHQYRHQEQQQQQQQQQQQPQRPLSAHRPLSGRRLVLASPSVSSSASPVPASSLPSKAPMVTPTPPQRHKKQENHHRRRIHHASPTSSHTSQRLQRESTTTVGMGNREGRSREAYAAAVGGSSDCLEELTQQHAEKEEEESSAFVQNRPHNRPHASLGSTPQLRNRSKIQAHVLGGEEGVNSSYPSSQIDTDYRTAAAVAANSKNAEEAAVTDGASASSDDDDTVCTCLDIDDDDDDDDDASGENKGSMGDGWAGIRGETGKKEEEDDEEEVEEANNLVVSDRGNRFRLARGRSSGVVEFVEEEEEEEEEEGRGAEKGRASTQSATIQKAYKEEAERTATVPSSKGRASWTASSPSSKDVGLANLCDVAASTCGDNDDGGGGSCIDHEQALVAESMASSGGSAAESMASSGGSESYDCDVFDNGSSVAGGKVTNEANDVNDSEDGSSGRPSIQSPTSPTTPPPTSSFPLSSFETAHPLLLCAASPPSSSPSASPSASPPCTNPTSKPADTRISINVGGSASKVGDNDSAPIVFVLSADLEALCTKEGEASDQGNGSGGGDSIGGDGGDGSRKKNNEENEGADHDDGDDGDDVSSGGGGSGRSRSKFSQWGSSEFSWSPLVEPKVPRPRKATMYFFDPELAVVPEHAEGVFTRPAEELSRTCNGGGSDDDGDDVGLATGGSIGHNSVWNDDDADAAAYYNQGIIGKAAGNFRSKVGDDDAVREESSMTSTDLNKTFSPAMLKQLMDNESSSPPPPSSFPSSPPSASWLTFEYEPSDFLSSSLSSSLSSTMSTSMSSSTSSPEAETPSPSSSWSPSFPLKTSSSSTPTFRPDTYGEWMRRQSAFVDVQAQSSQSSSSPPGSSSLSYPMVLHLFDLLRRKRLEELGRKLDLWHEVSSGGEGGGVFVDAPLDEFGNTLLLAACQHGSRKAVKWCLGRGSNSNAQNRFGNTCLHFLVEFKLDAIARHLQKKHGADSSIPNVRGLTCFQRIADK